MDRFSEILEECNTDFLLFTQTICAYCNRAKNILKSKKIDNNTIDEAVYAVVFNQAGILLGVSVEGSKYTQIER